MAIIFTPSSGGLGDGIVGCRSAFILAKVLGVDFKIANGSVKFYNFFDIPDKYKSKSTPNFTYCYTPSKDNDNVFLKSDLNIFKNKKINIITGQNFSRFLYKNEYFKNKINIPEMDVIQYLFENILIPKKSILNKLTDLKQKYDIQNKVAVHIRCNNVWNDSNRNEGRFSVIKTINNFIQCIKTLNIDKVVLLSDNMNNVRPIFKQHNIEFIEIDGKVGHSLKTSNLDYEKTLLDMLLIGACKFSIISFWSNYGRIGVLRKKKDFFIVMPVLNQPIEKFDYNVKMNLDIIFRKGNNHEILSKEGNSIL